jgi:hypothetical protein
MTEPLFREKTLFFLKISSFSLNSIIWKEKEFNQAGIKENNTGTPERVKYAQSKII